MVDNLQNTNPSTLPGSDLTSQPAASSANAPAAVDLSGLGASFSKPKSTEERKKIDFTVDEGAAAKEKVMRDAAFEKNFFRNMTRAGVIAVIFLVLSLLGYIFKQYLGYVE